MVSHYPVLPSYPSLLLTLRAKLVFFPTAGVSSPQLIFYCTNLKSAPYTSISVTRGWYFVYFVFHFRSASRKASRLVDKSILTPSESLPHHRTVASPSPFYQLYCGFCPTEFASSNPFYVTFSLSTRTQAARQPYQISVVQYRAFFRSSLFFRTSKLYNTLALFAFSPTYNLALFESRIDKKVFTLIFP